MKQIKSTIDSVTVYKDRAQVIRIGEIELGLDEHILVFDNLPKSIERKSIQVNGSSNAILKNIKYDTVYYEEDTDAKLNELKKVKLDIEDSIYKLDIKAEIASKEQIFVENISFFTTNKTKKNTNELDPDKWNQMILFYTKKLENISNKLIKIKLEKRELNKKLAKTISEINQFNNNTSKSKNQVQVTVEIVKQGLLDINLTYIVYGPQWYSLYDLRVLSHKKTMSVAYNAMVKQYTGEDWTNVKLKLSTAQVQIGGNQAELNPWYIDKYIEQEKEYRTLSPPVFKKRAKKKELTKSAIAESFDNISRLKTDMAKPKAKVETGTTAVVFVVAGKSTINNNNKPTKVNIFNNNFEAEFIYSSVPKLSQYAYLKTKIKNNTEFSFLPGETSIFLDNHFVANSKLKLVAPSEEFWTFLGVDESIKIEYKFLKKYQKDEGIFSKKTKMLFEYLIKIKNNKKTKEKIIITDQIPISQNDDIKVTLISPKYKEDTDTLKISELKYIEWNINIEKAKEIELDLKYSIEYPKDDTITGIDS